MSDTTSSKPAGLQKDTEISSNSLGQFDDAAQHGTPEMKAIRHESWRNHHVISTGTYYQAESNGFADYGDDQAHEWESDGETGEV